MFSRHRHRRSTRPAPSMTHRGVCARPGGHPTQSATPRCKKVSYGVRTYSARLSTGPSSTKMTNQTNNQNFTKVAVLTIQRYARLLEQHT